MAFAAIKHILKLTPAKAALHLEQVLNDADDLDPHAELLEQPEIAECCDDLDALNAHIENQKSKRELVQSARKLLKETTVKGPPLKRKPVTFKAVETWSPENAMALAPPETKFYRDNWNKRWLCWAGAGPMSGRWCRSRSWGVTGDDNKCISELLKLLWRRHTELTGEESPIDFTSFDASVASSTAKGSAPSHGPAPSSGKSSSHKG